MNNNATPPNPAVEDPAQQTTPVLSSTRPEPTLETGETGKTKQIAEQTATAPTRFGDILSGQFDADAHAHAHAQEPAAPKRVLTPMPDTPKLHKVLAQAGMGSRLEMEQLIQQGRITVNNQPAHVGQRIQFGDSIKVHGKPIRVRIAPPPARVIAYHKPVGEVVTHDDPQNRPTVFRKLPKLMQGKWQSVGRLDLNTEGLLLFTSSGELANQLMHPRFGLEREYAVRVLGALTKEEKQMLLDGVQLEDGRAQFGAIEDGGGEGSNCWYRVTISEGRNREVRRMLEAVGHAVSRLIRIRYGAMLLPRGLKRGAWMELDEADIRSLMLAAGGSAQYADRPSERPMRTASGPDPRRPRSSRQRMGGPRGNGNSAAAKVDAKAVSKPALNPARTGRENPHAKPPERSQQPNPMKTAQGYIGADSFNRQRQQRGQRSSGGGSSNGPAQRSGSSRRSR